MYMLHNIQYNHHCIPCGRLTGYLSDLGVKFFVPGLIRSKRKIF